MARLPQEIKNVFNEINAIAPCIIAGGAIRDTLNGKLMKDIDVFIDAKYKSRFNNTTQWRPVGSPRNTTFPTMPGAPVFPSMQSSSQSDVGGYSNQLLDSVLEDDHSHIYDVQLVFVTIPPVEYVTEYFDLGICKTWYDGTRIYCHKDYTRDVNNKTITMVMDSERFKRAYTNPKAALALINEHAFRINRKYGFRLQIPQEAPV